MTTTSNPNPPVECPHQHFHVTAEVQKDTLAVYVWCVCKQCGKPLIFPGQGERAMLQGTWN